MWISLVSWSGKEALGVVFVIKGFIIGTGALRGVGELDEGMKFWKAAAGGTESHQPLQPKILKWHVCECMFGRVWLLVIPWAVTHLASLSMGLSRQESWSGLPFPSPGDISWPRDRTRVSCIGRQGDRQWLLWYFPHRVLCILAGCTRPGP